MTKSLSFTHSLNQNCASLTCQCWFKRGGLLTPTIVLGTHANGTFVSIPRTHFMDQLLELALSKHLWLGGGGGGGVEEIETTEKKKKKDFALKLPFS